MLQIKDKKCSIARFLITKDMLTVKNVEFAYNQANSFRFPDFTCQKGEHWLIMGASGCGKTTLLHLLAGLLRPSKGTILVDGIELNSLTNSQTDAIRGKQIGIVFQKHYFIQSLTVAENLSITRYLNGLKITKQEIQDLLDRFNIGGKMHSRPNELSQGELQRLSIARAMINNPSVIIADEPTSSLDDKHCVEAITLLRQQAEKTESALVIVTHDQRLHPFFTNSTQLNNAKQ
jgi:ABC-type lipoprotein export system ATPase subunit